jgi:hypothetical protein
MSTSVEQLREQAAAAARSGDIFALWVPDELTLNGQLVRRDVGMAILVDAILALGFMPDGLTEGAGGATYRYRRM